MIQNKKHYKIEGEKVILVPYLKSMVPKYNQWMKEPFLLQMTGSEPLTLEEEYEMQKSWLTDESSKYTFIILQRVEDKDYLEKGLPDFCKGGRMIGDVNLYFHGYFEDFEAEIEIMIAEADSRGKGLAFETLKLMMIFGDKYCNKIKFIAKIKNDNIASIKLFEKLGYKLMKELKQFEEVHYDFDISENKDLFSGIELKAEEVVAE